MRPTNVCKVTKSNNVDIYTRVCKEKKKGAYKCSGMRMWGARAAVDDPEVVDEGRGREKLRKNDGLAKQGGGRYDLSERGDGGGG